eukprot:4876442-Pyramimonas_sp.AAC.1
MGSKGGLSQNAARTIANCGLARHCAGRLGLHGDWGVAPARECGRGSLQLPASRGLAASCLFLIVSRGFSGRLPERGARRIIRCDAKGGVAHISSA